MVTSINQTYCGHHFTKYINVKSLCFTPETNNVCQLDLKKKILCVENTKVMFAFFLSVSVPSGAVEWSEIPPSQR